MAHGATWGADMGLLDFTDDPKTMGLLSLGLGMLNSKGGNALTALGQAGPGALDAMRQVKIDAQRKQQMEQQQAMQAMQMQQAQLALAAAQQQQQAAAEAARTRGGYLNSIDSSAGPALPFNPVSAMRAGLNASEIEQLGPKANKPLIVGDTVLDPQTMRPLWSAPQKPPNPPAAIQEYEYAKGQGYGGTFEQFQTGLKKAGATNIGMPKIEVKMGESVAGQVGPMAKDSRIQAQGAVGMFDAADRIQRALDSGKASAGPFTTQIQTVKQLVQKVGGGNDEGIRQTRQVVKSLAQMAVEARKELAGQGAVTEGEAAATAKAESGDINDLTLGELQDLVTLTKRAAHMRAKNHQSMLDSLSGSEGTKGLVPFYKVQGLDALLQHTPQLPKIGGGNRVDDALKKYGGK